MLHILFTHRLSVSAVKLYIETKSLSPDTQQHVPIYFGSTLPCNDVSVNLHRILQNLPQ